MAKGLRGYPLAGYRQGMGQNATGAPNRAFRDTAGERQGRFSGTGSQSAPAPGLGLAGPQVLRSTATAPSVILPVTGRGAYPNAYWLPKPLHPDAVRWLAQRGMKFIPQLRRLAGASRWLERIPHQVVGTSATVNLGSFTDIQQDCGGPREWFRSPGGAWPCGAFYALPTAAMNSHTSGANTVAWGSAAVPAEFDPTTTIATFGGWAREPVGATFVEPHLDVHVKVKLADSAVALPATGGTVETPLPFKALPYRDALAEALADLDGARFPARGYAEPRLDPGLQVPYFAYQIGQGFIPPGLTRPGQTRNAEKPRSKERQGKWFLGGNLSLAKWGGKALVAGVGMATEFGEAVDVLYKNLATKHKLKHKKGDRLGAAEKMGAIFAHWGDLTPKWGKVGSELLRAGMQDLVFGSLGMASAVGARTAGMTTGFQLGGVGRAAAAKGSAQGEALAGTGPANPTELGIGTDTNPGAVGAIPAYWNATGARLKPSAAAKREAARQKAVTKAVRDQAKRQAKTNFSRVS